MTAAALRFWQLGQLPPGLYRDEAYNGLDAVDVLEGHHSLFFSRNNGREPLYIYLTSLSISIFGRTPLALRLAAAAVGTLTTWLTYQLASTWFGWRVGLLSAWLWAVTVWPLHLGRIGLRVGLLPAALALVFWLATLAYRRQDNRLLWLAAGLAYGAAWYTYLAVRFTPLLLFALLLYLVATGRQPVLTRLWPAVAWFAGGAMLVVMPLALLAWQQPAMILGRSSQVSILNPAINEGNFLGALWQHAWQALGLFFWRGDTILRHNPAGRPLFDPLMAIPFMLGVVYCLRNWQRPAAATLLLWTAVMLGPTILAEDTPHFLRAAGILPAAVIFPALGLSQFGSWTTLPRRKAQAALLAASLLAASLFLTVRDYFVQYNHQPETAYLFETAARDLAEQVNDEADGVTILLEQRLWDGWPSVQFLLDVERPVTRFQLESGLPAVQKPAAIYVWPHQNLDSVAAAVVPPALVLVEEGSLARGDLETEAYPLHLRYGLTPFADEGTVLANFDNQLLLRRVEVTAVEPLQVDLYWSSGPDLTQPVVAFVHVMEDGRLIAQSDAPPALGRWPFSGWQPGLIIQDRRHIEMGSGYDRSRHQLYVGLYDPVTQLRRPVLDQAGRPVADSWLLPVRSEGE